ncbi:hypothetical protein ACGFU4_05715 [Streptomyces sp. NPDC048511]|uniref:hypothetical protein n=1 Tax=Streptomyces sp. NPDC048511 TaxID=3365562 RepID=UPI00371FC771
MGSASEWARKTFGDAADELVDVIPACLLRAHTRARNGHEGVHTQTLEAYGHGLYAVQYEELATGLGELADARPVRLQGRTLVIASGYVIYPIRYAKKDVPVTAARLRRATGFRAELIRRHGPEPRQQMLDLGMDELEEPETHPDLGLLPEDVRLVLVAYACSMDQGVVRAEWGSAELRREDRYLVWHHHEPLPLDGRTTTAS